jgi:hypothetical protein
MTASTRLDPRVPGTNIEQSAAEAEGTAPHETESGMPGCGVGPEVARVPETGLWRDGSGSGMFAACPPGRLTLPGVHHEHERDGRRLTLRPALRLDKRRQRGARLSVDPRSSRTAKRRSRPHSAVGVVSWRCCS